MRFISRGGQYEDKERMARDMMTTLGFITGLPLGQLGKPLGYFMGLRQGTEEADTPAQVLRGVAGGPSKN